MMETGNRGSVNRTGGQMVVASVMTCALAVALLIAGPVVLTTILPPVFDLLKDRNVQLPRGSIFAIQTYYAFARPHTAPWAIGGVLLGCLLLIAKERWVRDVGVRLGINIGAIVTVLMLAAYLAHGLWLAFKPMAVSWP